MGVPEFQIRPLLRAQQVRVFSSNYRLYGDMSQRVMATLEQFCRIWKSIPSTKPF